MGISSPCRSSLGSKANGSKSPGIFPLAHAAGISFAWRFSNLHVLADQVEGLGKMQLLTHWVRREA